MSMENLIKVCKQIAFDVENDAKEFDGKPFIGEILGTYMGNTGAVIQALANVI